MTFSGNVDLGDIASILVLVAAAVGLFLTLKQLRQNEATQRAIFVRDLYSRMSDEDMVEGVPLLEGAPLDLSPESSFFDSPAQLAINKLLAHCELISALHLRGALSYRDMDHFEYHLRRVLQADNTRRYFELIDGFCADRRFDPKRGPFSKLRLYGAQLGYDTGMKQNPESAA